MTASRALLLAGALLAAQASMADETVPPSLQACARIANDGERLGCFDREVARIVSGAPAAAPATPVALFGANRETQQAAAPAAAVQREELQEIVARATAVTTLASGRLRIELDNGQVWQQIESGTLQVKPGMEIRIKRGALDSFLLTTPAKRSAKVHRLR